VFFVSPEENEMKLRFVVMEHPINSSASPDEQAKRLLKVPGVVSIDMEGFYLSDRVWLISFISMESAQRNWKHCITAIEKTKKGDFFDSEWMRQESRECFDRLHNAGRKPVRLYISKDKS
jgi:hypothetical protein